MAVDSIINGRRSDQDACSDLPLHHMVFAIEKRDWTPLHVWSSRHRKQPYGHEAGRSWDCH